MAGEWLISYDIRTTYGDVLVGRGTVIETLFPIPPIDKADIDNLSTRLTEDGRRAGLIGEDRSYLVSGWSPMASAWNELVKEAHQ